VTGGTPIWATTGAYVLYAAVLLAIVRTVRGAWLTRRERKREQLYARLAADLHRLAQDRRANHSQ
jgi:hypothetical protein